MRIVESSDAQVVVRSAPGEDGSALDVYATVQVGRTRGVITRLDVSGGRVTAQALRALSLPMFAACATGDQPPIADAEEIPADEDEAVAFVYRRAVRVGTPPARAVAEEFGYSRQEAYIAIKRVRRRGLLPPSAMDRSWGGR